MHSSISGHSGKDFDDVSNYSRDKGSFNNEKEAVNLLEVLKRQQPRYLGLKQ